MSRSGSPEAFGCGQQEPRSGIPEAGAFIIGRRLFLSSALLDGAESDDVENGADPFRFRLEDRLHGHADRHVLGIESIEVVDQSAVGSINLTCSRPRVQ